jgi:integrase
MSKKEILNDYILHKRVTVNAIGKLKDIEYYIGKFIDSVNDIEKVDEKSLINFLNSLTGKYSIRSINDIKAYLKNFIKWKYLDHSVRFRNLDALCKSKKPEKAYMPEDMLSKEEVEKLIQGENNIHWKTFFITYFYSGCRPIEVCNLKWDQITFEKEGGFIKIFSEKNKEHFDKYIPEEVTFYLKKIQNNKSKWVFPTVYISSRGDAPIKEKAVYHRLKKLSLNVLGKHVNPYVLRHSIATILYNRDDLKDDDVAKQMGHTKDMRQTYVNLSQEKIKERMRKIYIKAEDLPVEKKHEIEKQLSLLNEKLANQEKDLNWMRGFFKELHKEGEVLVYPDSLINIKKAK